MPLDLPLTYMYKYDAVSERPHGTLWRMTILSQYSLLVGLTVESSILKTIWGNQIPISQPLTG